MVRRGAIRAVLGVSVVVAMLSGAAAAQADPPADLTDDGTGKRWRALTDTTRLTPDQVAQVCPRDGATPCAGAIGTKDLTAWVWATGDQVVALLGRYDPALLAASPPSVGGGDHFFTAYAFLEDMRPTFSVTGYNFHHSFAGGWTASTDEAGQPIAGAASYGFYPPAGGFSVLPTGPGQPGDWYGVWLWRPSTDDITAPTVAPSVSGTLGNNGWYVSDVSVSWAVGDEESEVSASTGCQSATVATDTAATSLTCVATSSGGTTSSSVTVKRDTTLPTVTCSAAPQVFEIYQLGAWVRATVADQTSGPASPLPQGATNTSAAGTFMSTVTGVDAAGNRTTTSCAYQVVVPACGGFVPTIVGNAQNNVINGTNGGDVIVGLGGADTINGLGSNDVICGGDGPDKVYGDDGNDWIDGGASGDDLNGGKGDDYIDGGLHNDSIRGDDGQDTCVSGEVRMSSC